MVNIDACLSSPRVVEVDLLGWSCRFDPNAVIYFKVCPMKSNFFVKSMGAGVLALSLAILPSISPASAQATTQTDPVVPGAGTNTTTTTDNRNDGFDWGWLGLLGLIGLAGLKGRDNDTTTYRDSPSTTTTPASNNPRY